MQSFKLTAEQYDQISFWRDNAVYPLIEERQKQYGRPYYGAIGGGLTYSFKPTVAGTIIFATEAFTKMVIYLTEVDKTLPGSDIESLISYFQGSYKTKFLDWVENTLKPVDGKVDLTLEETGTSLGSVTVVKDGITGKEINLTDYDEW